MAEARLRARADLNTKNFDTGIAKMKQGVSSFASGQLSQIAGMVGGAFAVGALVNFGRNALQRADDLGNLSNATNMNVEALQAWTWAAGEFGAASEESARAKLIKLIDTMGKAVNGGQEQIDVFRRLGISMRELEGMTTDQVLYRVALGAQKSTTAVTDLNEVFGRGAAFEMKDALDALANNGMEGIITKAKQAGQALDEELISKLGQLNDDLNRTQRQIGNSFTKFFANLTNGIKDTAASLGAMAGTGIAEGLSQFTGGDVGVSQERKAFKDEKERKRVMKLEQEKVAIKFRKELEYQEALKKIMEKAAKEQLAATVKYETELAKRKKEAREKFEKEMELTDELQRKTDEIMNAKQPEPNISSLAASDQYARIGLFSGGQINNAPRMLGERQVAQQEETNRRIHRVAELQAETNRQLRKMTGE